MSAVLPAEGVDFDLELPVVVIGAGACGLVAALAARQSGAEVLVLERDSSPSGSTSLSSGLIPAAPTRFQQAAGITDSAEAFAADIQAKARNQADPDLVKQVTEESGPVLEWLADAHGLEWVVLDGFLYPGHRRHRMHTVPEKTGSALLARLLAAAGRAGVEIVTDARVTALYAVAGGGVRGLSVERPDGSTETIGCRALVLACNGFGGNRELVAHFIPEMTDADYFGHAGNQGDAVLWGRALGGAVRHMGAYQGHGSVATPHGILITWALMMEGGIQVNADGRRFSNEHAGYSEQAVAVLGQPGGVAWSLYDARLHELGLTFEDYRSAHAAGAVRVAENVGALAEATGLPEAGLRESLAEVEACRQGVAEDSFGRDFAGKPGLSPPYHVIKVTGALFHTQGGLVVDRDARVLRADGSGLPNLFAGGGAACGVSGPEVCGYLSGNGLLTAVTLGCIAGRAAGRLALE